MCACKDNLAENCEEIGTEITAYAKPANNNNNSV